MFDWCYHFAQAMSRSNDHARATRNAIEIANEMEMKMATEKSARTWSKRELQVLFEEWYTEKSLDRLTTAKIAARSVILEDINAANGSFRGMARAEAKAEIQKREDAKAKRAADAHGQENGLPLHWPPVSNNLRYVSKAELAAEIALNGLRTSLTIEQAEKMVKDAVDDVRKAHAKSMGATFDPATELYTWPTRIYHPGILDCDFGSDDYTAFWMCYPGRRQGKTEHKKAMEANHTECQRQYAETVAKQEARKKELDDAKRKVDVEELVKAAKNLHSSLESNHIKHSYFTALYAQRLHAAISELEKK